MALAFVVITGACSGTVDEGDPVAFCDLLEQGIGLGPTGEFSVEDYAQLADVAPPDIRPAVRKLTNTARSLDEIEPENLDELFAAAFDPSARDARAELESYARTSCGVDRSDEVIGEVERYLEQNFGTAPWIGLLGFDVEFAADAVEEIVASFSRPPRDDAWPLEVCSAISVYLYEIVGEDDGRVVVRVGSAVAASREGRDAECLAP